jgi:hypothetical protein
MCNRFLLLGLLFDPEVRSGMLFRNIWLSPYYTALQPGTQILFPIRRPMFRGYCVLYDLLIVK